MSRSITNLIHERVEAAQRGENPTVIARLPSGWAVLADRQFLRGSCLLLADPVVTSLNELDRDGRVAFLADMARLGDAILAVTEATRINYEILGNLVPSLHAHLFPRSKHEDPDFREGPVWSYPRERRLSVPFDRERDRALLEALREELSRDR